MKVYLTGATGFVGRYVLQALRAAGHEVRCLVRQPDHPLPFEEEGVEKVGGDLLRPETFAGTLDGCEAVVHLVGIIAERPRQGISFDAVHRRGTLHMVEAAQQAGISRFIHMSANGVRPDGTTAYQTSKWEAEEIVRHAGFAHWTIFRPSIIFGDPKGAPMEFVTELARRLVRPLPVLPVFGDGQYRLQPVAVEVVAAAFAQALTRPEAHGQTYCVAGPTPLTYDEILDVIARALRGRPKPKLHLPLGPVRLLVGTLGRIGLLPVTPEQLAMLIEGNTCDPSAFYRDFDVHRCLSPRRRSPTCAGRPEDVCFT
ncbi:SDR family oxidoreductase [Rhodothermus marinus]|uniref:SDR family oxidoreductase n=1 Tax=Rhodothermus marinus TaxID=29549 RepID=UPI000A907B3D|nr:NAD-dependent epimerase/dehydratase family protein [Rhodothermus marinus]